ncbi:MAG: hypothetical protein CMQ15_10380 [Gammaproteobacteria bacterium]|nr:hypothetical protein [Gammaproteobacteria bacterium]
MENFSQGYGLGTKSGSKIDESSSGDDLVSTNTGSAYSLREDRLVLCMAAALAVAAILLLIPNMNQPWQVVFSQYLLEIPFLAILLVTIRIRLKSVESVEERRFWILFFIGFAVWVVSLATELLFFAVELGGEILQDLLINAPIW